MRHTAHALTVRPAAALAMALAFAALAPSCTRKGAAADPTAGYSSERLRMETAAAPMLDGARRQLAAGQLDEARATIGRMRSECRLALTARRQGILLMDSIDIAAAKRELVAADSTLRRDGAAAQPLFDEACRKVQFYERKLRHDIGQAQ